MQLIILRVAQNCLELARGQASCCILQECIEYSNNNLRQLQEVLISPLIQDVYDLSKHPYGNYVIQFMIQLDGTNIGRRIIKELTHKFVELSMDKYGSNVVEKCLSCCEGISNDIIFEILEGNGRDRLIQICTNQYGNFVVQTVMSIAKGKIRKLLEKAIKSHWLVLQQHLYGRNVISSIRRDKKKAKLSKYV
uniref:PUM-HD domain-containing protein n=1 Tax=Cucumis sativus TaxID=3659 RepID=A0A0A0K7S4_CUCSA